MIAKVCFPITLALTVAAAIVDGSVCDGWDILRTYDLFTSGDLSTNSDVEGKTFVGGSLISSSSANFGIHLSTTSEVTFEIAGAVGDGSPININKGSVRHNSGTSSNLSSPNVGWDINGRRFNINDGNSGANAASKSDITLKASELANALDELSDYLKILPTTGTVTIPSGQPSALNVVVASKDSNGFAVFNTNGNSFFNNNHVQQIEVKNNIGADLIIINVAGTSINWSNGNVVGSFLTAVSDRSKIIWNFYEATSINFNSKNMMGNVVAPKATVTTAANIDGATAVKKLVATSEVHFPLLSVSCPTTTTQATTATHPTTSAATTQATTTAATTTGGGYCSWWDCTSGPSDNDWCNASEGNCLGAFSGVLWCTPPTTAQPTTTAPISNGGACGDPHIKRWNRKPFMFHGECDLVLVHSDHVNGDKTLDVNIRTAIVKYLSQIDSAAMKVGDVTLQVGMDKLFINGEHFTDKDLPIETDEFVVTEPIHGDEERSYILTLTDHITVTFKIVNGFMNVVVSGSEHDFGQSVGLMGDFYLGKPYARSGERMYDLQEFAFEWQANPVYDPLLFKDERGPQLPSEKCRLPKVTRSSRRLRASNNKEFVKAAENACANKSEYEACMSDVLNTENVPLAKVW